MNNDPQPAKHRQLIADDHEVAKFPKAKVDVFAKVCFSGEDMDLSQSRGGSQHQDREREQLLLLHSRVHCFIFPFVR